MCGISSKALNGTPENKKKFVAQDFENDFSVDWYQFKFRNHDAQIGRFIEVDPLADKYVYNSTYAYAENRPIDGIDLEGKEFWRAVGETLKGNLSLAGTLFELSFSNKKAQYNESLNAAYRLSTNTSEVPSTPGPPAIQNAQASLNKLNDIVKMATPAIDVLDATATLASFTPVGEAGVGVRLLMGARAGSLSKNLFANAVSSAERGEIGGILTK